MANKIAIFIAIDFSNGDNCADPAEEVLKSKGITLSACRMVLAYDVFPLLMKPSGDFEGVGEFGKLLFILALDIGGLCDSGVVILVRGVFNPLDFQNTFRQTYKKDFIDSLLTVFKVFFAKMLFKPRFRKQHNKDLEQNPLAHTLMTYRSTSQPLDFITDFNGKCLLILWSCNFSIFSFQGQVNSISITFLAEFE